MKLPLILSLLFSLLFSASLFAEKELISIREVKFFRATDDWTVAMIKIDAQKNPDENARDRDYLENIKITLTLAYEPKYKNAPKGQFDFYRSDVEIIAMKAAEPKMVYFALPGVIVKRDRLEKDPFAWMIDLEVNGNKIEPTEEHISKELRKGGVAQSFISKANSESPDNDDLLMPSYLAPGIFKYKNQPDFIRREAE